MEMMVNQTEGSRLEQRSVIKLLVDKKCKPYDINKGVSDMYGEACFNQENVYKWSKHGFVTRSLSVKDFPWSRF